MEYGYGAILIAESEDGEYQVIGICDTESEAVAMAHQYIEIGPDRHDIVPSSFTINRRNHSGHYVKQSLIGMI